MSSETGAAILFAQFEQHGLARPNHIADPEGGAWDAYVWTDNVDGLNRQFKANGVKIVRDVSDKPYGCRDFDVEDCNGYRLCFGQVVTDR